MFKRIINNVCKSLSNTRNFSVSGDNAKVTINNKTYSGNSIVINGDGIEVDGVKQEEIQFGEIHVTVEGDVDSVKNEFGDVAINGDVDGDVEASMGDVTVKGNVGYNVETSQGDVSVTGQVYGDANTSMGDIKASQIHGKATTSMGDIIVG